jgi:hypothetical protein
MPEPTLAPVVFPSIWKVATERHPDPPDWADKLRTLAALCLDYWDHPDLRLSFASEGEKRLLWSFGHLGADLEPFILACAAQHPHDPLCWLGDDPCVAGPSPAGPVEVRDVRRS